MTFEYIPSQNGKDCTVKALSIICDISYDQALRILGMYGRGKNSGFMFYDWIKNLPDSFPIHFRIIEPDCIVKDLQLDDGKYIIEIPKHVFALINGVIYDGHFNYQSKKVKMIYAKD